MNTSLGSNKRGGASADSSAITRMRKLAAIAGNYNQPSKQQKFPAGVVSVGLANSALQVFQNTTKGVAPPKLSFSIVPIGLGNTTQTLNVVYSSRLASQTTFPSFSEGCFAVYSFTSLSTTTYTFTITPSTAPTGQQIYIVPTYAVIRNEYDLFPVITGVPPFDNTDAFSNGIGAPSQREYSMVGGTTYYLAVYSMNGDNSTFTPQTYTLNIAEYVPPPPAAPSPTTPYSPASGGSLSFNGTVSSYLKTPSTGRLIIGNQGAFTIEWFQYMFSQSNFARVFSIGSFGDVGGATIAVSIEGGDFYFWLPNRTFTNMGSAGPINTWAYFAISSDGTNIKVFKDGVQLGSTLTPTYDISGPLPDLTLGNETTPTSVSSFQGFITGFRWTSGVGRYPGLTHTVPISPPAADSDTTLLLNTATNGGAFTDSSLDNRMITQSGVVWYGP